MRDNFEQKTTTKSGVAVFQTSQAVHLSVNEGNREGDIVERSHDMSN